MIEFKLREETPLHYDRIQTPKGISTPRRSNSNSERNLHSKTIEFKLRKEPPLQDDRIQTPKGHSTPYPPISPSPHLPTQTCH